jgi:hypothetical protein
MSHEVTLALEEIGDKNYTFFQFIHNEMWSFKDFLMCYSPYERSSGIADMVYKELSDRHDKGRNALYLRRAFLDLFDSFAGSPSTYWRKAWRAKLEGMCGSCEGEILHKSRTMVKGDDGMETFSTIYCPNCRHGELKHL